MASRNRLSGRLCAAFHLQDSADIERCFVFPFFCFIQGHICIFLKGDNILSIIRKNRESNAEGGINFFVSDIQRRFEEIDDTFGKLDGIMTCLDIVQDNDKFIPPYRAKVSLSRQMDEIICLTLQRNSSPKGWP